LHADGAKIQIGAQAGRCVPIDAAPAGTGTDTHNPFTREQICLKKDTTPANITISIRFTTYP
jgi:hypothetical protein